jgi:hypothetical protein
VSLGSWDPALSSWRTSQVSLLSTEDERFPRSSERWPTSGMTRRGRAFALPMSERATVASGSSCWQLPTPSQSDGTGGGVNPRGWEAGRRSTGDGGASRLRDVAKMLHTPTTGDTNPSYDHRASPGYTRAKPVPNLAAQVEDELLPTPRHEGFDAGNHRGQPDSLNQTIRQLPTPTGRDWKGENQRADDSCLPGALASLGDPTPEQSDDGSEP